jgi:hypothetical protein
MSSLSWLEAAITVLRHGGQLTAREIVAEIERRQIRSISGQTPEATVGAVLYVAIQDGDPRVRLADKGRFEFGVGEAPTTTQTLGRIETVNPREVWPDEARNFTPWMLDNAKYLGEILGLEIELEAREHPIGPYYLDLFGRDITNQCVLIVENQLTATDHRHLGQLLTYAAGTRPQAGTIVWIAPEFRDEHREALDFLNSRVTGEETTSIRFFGVELSVVRIGNSIPAPQFQIVASPSGWNEQLAEVRAAVSGGGKAQAYKSFWAQYLSKLNEVAPNTTNVRTAPAANWLTVNYLRRGVQISLSFISGGLISAEIYIDLGHRTRNLLVFHGLKDSQDAIEQEIGQPLDWQELPGKRACRIRLTTPGAVTDTETFQDQINWFIKQQTTFKTAFRSRVDDLSDEIWLRDIQDDEPPVGSPDPQ